MPRRPHSEVLTEELKNTRIAVAYLNAAVDSGNSEYIMHAINAVMDANGADEASHIPVQVIEKVRASLSTSHIKVKFELGTT